MTGLIHPEHLKEINKLAATNKSAPVQRRARLLLLYHAGKPTAEVAREVGLSANSVLRWRRLYREQGMGIFPGAAASSSAAPGAKPEAKPGEKPKAEPKAGKKRPPKIARAVSKIVDAVEDFIGDEQRAATLKEIKTARPFKKFVAELETQRKAIKKRLKKQGDKGKKQGSLKKQLQLLDKQLKKAEKLLAKMKKS